MENEIKEVYVPPCDTYLMNIQEGVSLNEIVEILNTLQFAFTKDIYDTLSEDTKRHFELLQVEES